VSGLSAHVSLGERVRRLRAERGWSAQRLADECARLGQAMLTRGTIAKIESGVRKSVTAEEADVLGRALGVELEALVRGDDPAALMAELFFDEASARTVLAGFGFPQARYPAFGSPQTFWRAVVRELENGVIPDGMRFLLEEAAQMYPGNAKVRALLTQMTELRAGGESSGGPVPAQPGKRYPTLTLTGSDRADRFLEAVRAELGAEAELLYVSRSSSAVLIPDPGDASEQITTRVQQVMEALQPGSEVTYQEYSFRPYLLEQLVVTGPDGRRYQVKGVPATASGADVVRAVVKENTGRRARTVIDRMGVHPDRLDADSALHQGRVQDGDKLRVSIEAVAGGGSEDIAHLLSRNHAQQRLLAEIQDYSRANPVFEVVHLDDPALPSRIIIEFTAPGFAPPENLDVFLASAKHAFSAEYRALPFDTLEPVPIQHHLVTIELPPLFPATPPFVIWNTPIFHPNIWPPGRSGYRTGTLFVPQLAHSYDTTLSFADLCQTLVDVASYRVYDTEIFPDLPAAIWARSRFGQASASLTQRQVSPLALPPAGGSDELFPTLTLVGADLPDEFLEVVREQLGSDAADLLYVSKQQCAVLIPDPGDNAARLEQQIQEVMRTYAPGVSLQVIYDKYDFRPYLYSNLTVVGPDTTPYLLHSVPATMTPRDIAAAIVQETRAMPGKHGGTLSLVIHAETPGGHERLDPDRTLHENNVKDDGKLRLGTEAMAGSDSPEPRMDAQPQLRAQIRRCASSNDEFSSVDNNSPAGVLVPDERPGLEAGGPSEVDLSERRHRPFTLTPTAIADTEQVWLTDLDLDPDRPGRPNIVMSAQIHDLLVHKLPLSDRIEDGGFLLGRVTKGDDDIHLVEVTHVMPAQRSGAGPVHFTFTGESFLAAARLIGERGQAEDLVGWYHTHLFSVDPSMGLSSIDVELHLATFQQPWQVAALINLRQEGRMLRFYGRGDDSLLEYEQRIDADRGLYRPADHAASGGVGAQE
jgi:transcriptional regulator with XRE-family HTH domain/proteasome lid subunit RPN8/RPN11